MNEDVLDPQYLMFECVLFPFHLLLYSSELNVNFVFELSKLQKQKSLVSDASSKEEDGRTHDEGQGQQEEQKQEKQLVETSDMLAKSKEKRKNRMILLLDPKNNELDVTLHFQMDELKAFASNMREKLKKKRIQQIMRGQQQQHKEEEEDEEDDLSLSSKELQSVQFSFYHPSNVQIQKIKNRELVAHLNVLIEHMNQLQG